MSPRDRRGVGFDVIVIGEILVELSSTEPLGSGSALRLGFSGDALNSAAASAAAGAHTALLTRVADDELGQRILGRLGDLGIDTSLVKLVPGQQAVYFVHADPLGDRDFVYSRRGSAGSTLEPGDVIDAGVESAAVVVSTGVTCAISDSAAAAVLEAAQRARSFIYDPNFRPLLTTAAAASGALGRVAPYASLVTPACPDETGPLLATDDPLTAAALVRGLGADAVAVTRGPDGIVLDDGFGIHEVAAVPAPALIDQTGAGDSLVGTIAGRLALGDSLLEAVRLGSAASSLSLQGQGGTGFVASLEQSRAHLGKTGPYRQPG
jgi:2-dehydro-3-deoxygluconokinase